METKHGLPEEVIFCKKCIISNQRPNTSPEHKKKDSKIGTIGFKDGVCDACRFAEMKKAIDWDAREDELVNLLNKHRRNDGRYDVIVPGSGGKDSIYVSHMLKYEYDMNPLTVTWAPHIYTNVGWHNLQAWIKSGFDNILVTPNYKTHRYLTGLAFENLVNPFQPFIMGQKVIAPKIALQYDIPLIMYGENHAEVHMFLKNNFSPLMDIANFTRHSVDDELYFGGIPVGNPYDPFRNQALLRMGQHHIPPLEEDILEKGIEVHFFSYYHNWSVQEHVRYAKSHTDFKGAPNGRSEGTYTKYSSLDDKMDGQHYYTTYVKFGQGRATYDACRDIREGVLTREQGLEWAALYDHEFPHEYFKEILDYMQISKEHYWDIIENAKSPHLWSDEGILMHTAWGES